MKKLLLLLFVSIFTISCSSDDDSSVSQDAIIGNWYFFSDNGQEASDCIKMGTATFSSNGTFTSNPYEENITIVNGQTTTECVKGESNSAQWTNDGNNKYTLTNGNVSNTATVVFTDNNNTMSVTTSSGVEVYKRR